MIRLPANQLVDNYIPMPGHDYQGDAVSTIATHMGDRNFAALRRPYIDRNGHPAVTINRGRTTLNRGVQEPIKEHVRIRDIVNNYGIMLPVFNATTLRKEEWLELDRVVLKAARYRLRCFGDMERVASFGGFNGMNKEILEHETMSDPGMAQMDMDGLSEAQSNDAPRFQLEGLPLPITHSDFWFSSRKLGISKSSGTPLDMTMGEAAGRRVAETIEKVSIGIQTGPTYGGNSTQVGGYGRTSSVYGLINFSSRLTYTSLYAPTGVGRSGTGWVPADTLKDILAIRDQLTANKFFGPFMVYHSNDWDQYMDQDYSIAGGNNNSQTLRQRIAAIGKGEDNDELGTVIQGVKRLDMLFSATPSATRGPGGENITITATSPFTLVVIQMTPEVCRVVNGMDMTTLQWESVGGLRLNFKTMAIKVPQLRADYYGNCGIAHGTTA